MRRTCVCRGNTWNVRTGCTTIYFVITTRIAPGFGSTIKRADGSDLITIPNNARVRKLTPPAGHVEIMLMNINGQMQVEVQPPLEYMI